MSLGLGRLVFPARIDAQPHATSAPSPRAAGQGGPASSDATPRAALQHFLTLAERGHLEAAARAFEGADVPVHDAPELARRFRAVLEHHLPSSLEAVSNAPHGDPADGLPSATDEVLRIPADDGTTESVRMMRLPATSASEPPRWVFTRGTVARINRWFEALPDRTLLDHLPRTLRRMGPRGLFVWQWLALPLLGVLALVVALFLARGTRWLLSRITGHTRNGWDDELLARATAPLTLLWTTLLVRVVTPLLDLSPPAASFVNRLLVSLVFLSFFWMLLRVIDVVSTFVGKTTWAKHRGAAPSLLSLGRRVLKLALFAVALVAMLSHLGFPVASVIAGLGVGGLAVALAAQKTFENLFGAFALGLDQPFRIGDFVRIGDVVGTIEQIGFRSTRIRTLDRTLVTFPNGSLADKSIETFGARDRIRFTTTVRLVQGSTTTQVREVLAGIEAALRAQPKLWTDSLTVRLSAISESSLDVQVMAWFTTTDWDEFMAIRQDVLLQIIDLVEQSGSSFAFPTRTVHIVPSRGASNGSGTFARPDVHGLPSGSQSQPT